MRVCGGCGVPRRVAYKHVWKDNGVIETKPVALRGVWMEQELLQGVIDGIEESLGIPIDHLIVDAKRRDARLYVDNMLHGAAGRLIRNRLVRRAAYAYMIGQAASIGLARARVLEYRPGEYLLGRAADVYQESVFTGDVCGCFESVEKVRAKAYRATVGNTLVIKIESWPEGPEEERLKLERSTEREARVSFKRCGRCGLPEEVSGWRWDYRKGMVFDEITGKRIVFIDTGGINAVFRELTSELGEDILRIIAEKTRAFYEDLFRSKKRVDTPGLQFMEVRGYGVPEGASAGSEGPPTSLKVVNPFNSPMVAGLVAALLGAADSPVKWQDEDGVTEVHLR